VTAMGQATNAALGDRVAVEEGNPAADTAVVGIRNQGVTVTVIAGGRHMRGRAMAVAVGRPSRAKTVAMATGRPSRVNTVAMAMAMASRLNTRIIPPTAAMVALAGGRTPNVTVTVAVVKAAPGSLRADSLPAAAGSGIAQAADARADHAKRSAVLDDCTYYDTGKALH
jgi:hypothetical protein